MPDPVFAVFEGIDGCGKSTLAKKVFRKQLDDNIPTVLLHAPSDGRWGTIARNIIEGKVSVHPKEELDAFIEDLAYLSVQFITPALERGVNVLMDRYIFSTWAYQGLKHEDIDERVESVMECICLPDIVFLLDIPVEESLKRISKRGDAEGTYEKKDTLSKIRERYLSIKSPEAPHFIPRFSNIKNVLLDGTCSQKNLLKYTMEEISAIRSI